MTPRNRQHGLSLVEMMIAMTLGLMITGAIGYLFVGSRTTYRSQDANARVQDTGRFVMDYLGRQIQMAGRTEITPLAADSNIEFPGIAISGTNTERTLTYPVAGGGSQTRGVDELRVRYQLSNMGGSAILDCNGTAGAAVNNNTTILNTETTLNQSLTPISGSGGKQVGTVVTVFELRRHATRTLAGRGVAELFCWGNGGAAQPIAEGVEDLQFQYGLDTNNDATVDEWIATTPTAAQQPQIIAVEACVLIHSMEIGAVPAPMRVTDCSGATFTANDTLLYRTFRQVYTLRNRINATP